MQHKIPPVYMWCRNMCKYPLMLYVHNKLFSAVMLLSLYCDNGATVFDNDMLMRINIHERILRLFWRRAQQLIFPISDHYGQHSTRNTCSSSQFIPARYNERWYKLQINLQLNTTKTLPKNWRITVADEGTIQGTIGWLVSGRHSDSRV